MDKLEIISVLEVVVFGMAIAQMLLILLTVRRERDVRDLRDLVEEQRLRLTELRAWVAGRNASQPRQMASESKPVLDPKSNVNGPEAEMQPREPRSSADDLSRVEKALKWEQEVAARLQSGLSGQQATMPVQHGFKWFKDDPNEPRELAEARRHLNGRTYHPPQSSPEDATIQPRAQFTEVEDTFKAIKSLQEDIDKVSADLSYKPIARLN